MEAALAVTPEAAEAVEQREPEARTPEQIFKFSTWVHLGPGAEQCQEGESGDCADRAHFHAWCRLPNELQIRDIRHKAQAAKARRARQLRDPQSDSYEILDDDIEELGRLGEAARKSIVEDMLGKTWFADYLEAVDDVKNEETPDGDKPYEHIDEDDKRFNELQAMDPQERPQEEYGELDRHLTAYNDAVEARLRELQRPRREALEERDMNTLLDEVREDRIRTLAMEDFNVTYSTWEWYICSYLTPNGRRRFASLEEVQTAAPEVLQALKLTFNDLEQSFAEGLGKGS